MESDIIKISHLNKSFGEVKAVNDLSFRVKKGELFAFLGVNGAGKSTTISILCGLQKKDSGTVQIQGTDLDKIGRKVGTMLGVVFQDSVLDKPLTVRENLKNRAFFEESTVLTFYTIAGALSALANHDSVAKHSAFYTVDGDIQMGITDVCYATLRVRNHTFETIKEKPDTPRAIMEFKTIDLANALFNGTASTMAELCAGNIYMSGMINMIDNVNRILDRVGMYLG